MNVKWKMTMGGFLSFLMIALFRKVLEHMSGNYLSIVKCLMMSGDRMSFYTFYLSPCFIITEPLSSYNAVPIFRTF